MSILLDPHNKLSLLECPSTPHQFDDKCNMPYREEINSLMYVVPGMYPNISYAILFLAQFMQNLRRLDWEVVKSVFCYLQ